MSKGTHTQCRLQRGNSFTVTWLPSKFAIKGKIVKLKESKVGVWIDGWSVTDVWATMDSSYVNERSRDYLNTRKASDI